MDLNELFAEKSDFDRDKPVKVLRLEESESKKIVPVGEHKKKRKFASSDSEGCEPKVEIVQREGGECDLLFTCSCGEQSVIRCYVTPQDNNQGTAAA